MCFDLNEPTWRNLNFALVHLIVSESIDNLFGNISRKNFSLTKYFTDKIIHTRDRPEIFKKMYCFSEYF